MTNTSHLGNPRISAVPAACVLCAIAELLRRCTEARTLATAVAVVAVKYTFECSMEAKIGDLTAKVGKLMKENDSLRRELSEMRKLCEQRERAHESELLAIKKELDIVKLTQPDSGSGTLPGSPDMYCRVKSLKSSKRRPHSLHETMVIPPEVQGQLKLNGNISEIPNQGFLGSVTPFYFTVDNYSHLKKNALKWFSPPFYSHTQGYHSLYHSLYHVVGNF